MSAIEGRKVFADYYQDKKKLEGNDPQIQKALISTFQALAAFGKEKQATLQLEGKEIKIADLNAKEVKLFTHFAEQFFKKNSMKESDAQAIQEVFSQARRTCRDQFDYDSEYSEGVLGLSGIDAQFSSMEKDLFLNETVDEAKGSGVGKETEAKIVELLKKSQASAKERVLKGKALRKRGALFMVASVSLYMMAVVSIPVLISITVTPLFIPAFLILLTLATIALGLSFADFVEGGRLLKIENEEDRFKALERYRTIIREPEYEAFVKEHEKRYGSILQDFKLLSSFIELYKKEKEYKETYLATEDLAKAMGYESIESSKRPEIQVSPQFRTALKKLEYQIQEIQKRRKELELSRE